MSAHTPGPWIVNGDEVYSSHKSQIADCGGFSDSEANARLIAAAPDLLLALIDAMYQHDHKHLTHDEHWYHKAKCAIAKVKGK